MPKVKTCPICKKEFHVKPSHFEKRKYCSRECMAKGYTKPRLNKKCKKCSKEYEVYDNQWRRDSEFCSLDCMHDFHKGENHPNYKHGLGNKHPDVIEKSKRKYYENNRELCYQRSFEGKAKRRLTPIGHSFQDWIELLKEHDNRCFYCNEKMTKTAGKKQRTRDHIIPLSKGGTDEISNIVPACRSCNSSKGTKNVDKWKVQRLSKTR